MILRLLHLYPQTLSLYGDRGNIIALKQRAAWRGIEVQLKELEPGAEYDLRDSDLIFIGGGQNSDQLRAAEDLQQRSRQLSEVVEEEVVLLAICGGYQLLGNYYQTEEGRMIQGLGIFDLHTTASRERLTGNILIRAHSLVQSPEVVGFENHSGRTHLGKEATPLGQVILGYGNNGQDQTEGCRYKNAFGTYLHGPLLPHNPSLADSLLGLALKRRYGEVQLKPLDDSLEHQAHQRAVSVTRRKQ